MKKYELTSETIEHAGRTLYRIKAIRNFECIKAGNLGGFIEKEGNLSHDGNAWIYGNACVFGNALVYGNTQIYGDAWVYGNARVFGNVRVFGNARVFGDAYVYGDAWVSTGNMVSTYDYITLSFGGYNCTAIKEGVQIGCSFKSYDEWKLISKEEAISMGIKDFDYGAYRSFVEFAELRMKHIELLKKEGNL